MTRAGERSPRRIVAGQLLFFSLFAAALLLIHVPFLQLPYFWDELGQFVPAALDIHQHGWWIPKTTLPNVHPPGVMAYLAGVWHVTGISVTSTRVAMLLVAAAGMLTTFLLAIRLCAGLPGMPAFIAVLLLLCSPLFYTQSMMAQLDMPAIAFTSLALALFLDGRYLASALASIPLVLVKETSLVTPAVLALWLLAEKRVRPAFYYLLPAAALACWLAYLAHGAGHVFGNREFTHYNLTFPLHPVRLSLTLVRRVFYLFVDNFHWIGSVALVLAWRRTRVFRTRPWAVTAAVFAAQTLAVTVLGGAALERYLLPVLPLFYIACAAAFSLLRTRLRLAMTAGMAAGLAASLFIPSPFPMPYENNLAVVDFVTLQREAAVFAESQFRGRTIASAWPFPDALRRPEFGYVTAPLRVQGIENFNTATVLAARPDVLVIYSRTWEPRWGVLRIPWIKNFLARYYYYEPQITPEQIERDLGLAPVVRWERGGQWIEVYARAGAPSITL